MKDAHRRGTENSCILMCKLLLPGLIWHYGHDHLCYIGYSVITVSYPLEFVYISIYILTASLLHRGVNNSKFLCLTVGGLSQWSLSHW